MISFVQNLTQILKSNTIGFLRNQIRHIAGQKSTRNNWNKLARMKIVFAQSIGKEDFMIKKR